MKIIFFAHPTFLGSQSMPRFVEMLAEGMQERGHEVEVWKPEAKFINYNLPGFKKWLGYIDQYIVFPSWVKKAKRGQDKDVLYVFTDHALGPYVPLVADKPHVIHCHDFLAQRSALGQIAENRTSFSGKQYQAYIRSGYSRGRNFISVSEKTRADLALFLGAQPLRSEMVYNGLNPLFGVMDIRKSRWAVGNHTGRNLEDGYILHVGGNQWYKNRPGVIAIYNKWRSLYKSEVPLIMIGKPADGAMLHECAAGGFEKDILLVTDADDNLVKQAYAGAAVFLFPSLAEGFGWPIAEAMASGTVVITTGEAPMLEVAGDAALLIPRSPAEEPARTEWASGAAAVLEQAMIMSAEERESQIRKGLENSKRFRLDEAIAAIEKIYIDVVLNK